MTHKRITKEQVGQAWTGLVIVSIIFIGIFSWTLFAWSWIVWFVPAMTLVGAISTTLTYVSQGHIRCPHCGTELRDKTFHCPSCGREIASQCPKCATKVEWGERFCKNCGETLVGQQGSVSQQVVQPAQSVAAPAVETSPKPERKFCGLCGEPVNPGAKYCFQCGTQLE